MAQFSQVKRGGGLGFPCPVPMVATVAAQRARGVVRRQVHGQCGGRRLDAGGRAEHCGFGPALRDGARQCFNGTTKR